MRLTLRTLLAYLDNTLDPQDAKALRAKLDESGFATQLVQRIRASLANADLAAPSPDAVGPVEEANVISEYLDSTLTTEQVAEIERACLESDMHLAEAAACHQVLTMVLGESAEVTPELRERIYNLPQREIADIAAAGSFSSVAIPDQPSLDSFQDQIPTADANEIPTGKPVAPVGPEDSGVSDAPTRLRESSAADTGNASATQSRIPGVSPDNPFYGDSIRPSRITPWLVSLALAGVLLFALTRIFQPLMDRYTADTGGQAEEMQLDPSIPTSSGSGASEVEIEVPPEQSPVMTPVESEDTSADSNEPDIQSTNLDADAADTDSLPAPNTAPSPAAKTNQSPEVPTKADPADAASPATIDAPAKTDAATESDSTAEPPAPPSPGLNAKNDSAASDSPATDSTPADPAADPAVAAVDTPQQVMKDDAESPAPPVGEEVAEQKVVGVAKVTGDTTLIAGHNGDQKWIWLKKNVPINDGATLVCAPTFRTRMSCEQGFEVTAVGPTQLTWNRDEEKNITLQVDYGRILITSKKSTSLTVRLGETAFDLEFPEEGTVVAASLQYFRAPGFDPLIEQNRIPLAGVLSVQGIVNLGSDGSLEPLQTGQQWFVRGKNPPQTSVADKVPDWIDEPDPAKSTLESMARKDLLKLIDNDQPLEIALRQATTFRKSEVGSLAAQSLLFLGRGDTYFGGDGVLSNPKQRAYWPDHYQALMINVDRSAETAAAMNDAIRQMDAADGEVIFRLLTGFSQKQLVEGGDEELVRLLDSRSMAVRVLAIENLRKITGTTLYFKADEDNAIRRVPDIKKWQARQRKGDIRWQE